MSSLSKPLKLGVTGLGGYAAIICQDLLVNGHSDSPFVSLAAVCEPDLVTHEEKAHELRSKGVTVVQKFDDLLNLKLDGVWLPLPIPLHRSYTELALEAGIPVMCEKPAAGCVQDVDAMIAARDRAELPVAIGFQDIYKPTTTTIKRALLDGAIGKIESVTLTACWPRDSSYYGRSSWAGKLKQDGSWVMDSPASNALAHFINLALFMLGGDGGSASLKSVEAELYRVNAIENYDTCAFRFWTESDVDLIVCYTHACRQVHDPRLVIIGDRGRIIYDTGHEAVIETSTGSETISLHVNPHLNMIERFANLLTGEKDERAVATLEIARAHLVAVNGASEATPVYDIGKQLIDVIPMANGARLLALPNIEQIFDQCALERRLPSELRTVDWARKAGCKNLVGYNVFEGPLQLNGAVH